MIFSRFATFLLARPAPAWLALALTSGLAFGGILRIQFDDDLREVFRTIQRDNSTAERLARQFDASENAFVILVSGGRLLEPDTVEALRDFDFSLREIPGIARVRSLFDLRSTTPIDGYYAPLFPGPGGEDARYRAAAAALLDHPLARGVLVAKDARSLVFVAEPAEDHAQVVRLVPIEAQLRSAAFSLASRTGLQIDVGGTASLRTRIVQTSMREQMLFTVAGSIVGTLIAWLMFRRISAVLIAFPVPLVAAAWTLGAMGWIGERINPMNAMIGLLVMTIALTDTTHLLFAIRDHVAAGKRAADAVVAAVGDVGAACFLTSFTTTIAFLSLALSANIIVVRFGMACAAGTMLSFGAVMLWLPLLTATPLGSRLAHRGPARDAAAWDLRRLFPRLTPRAALWIAPAGALLTIAFAASSLGLETDYRYRENLSSSAPEWQAIERIDAAFGGSQPLHILIRWPDAPDDGGTRLFACLDRLHGALKGVPHTGFAISIHNLREAFRPGAESLAALIRELPDHERSRWIDPDSRATLVVVPLADAGASSLDPVLDRIELINQETARLFPGFQIELVGLTAASIRASKRMISELASSLALAAGTIFLVIGLALGSLRLGLCSILPNILPIAAIGFLLRATGQPLQYISALALTMCLGIAVDDTIHYLYRYRSATGAGMNALAAVHDATRRVGAALCASTIVLVAGLALLQVSSLPMVRRFSLLCIITLVIALLADLVVLPALLLLAPGKPAPQTNPRK